MFWKSKSEGRNKMRSIIVKVLPFILFILVSLLIGCSDDETTNSNDNNNPQTSDHDRFVLIGTNYDLLLYDLNDNSQSWLTTDNSTIEDYNGNFSNAGDKIIWQRYSPTAFGSDYYQVWIMDRAGSNKAKIANGYISPVGACSINDEIIVWDNNGTLTIYDFTGAVIGSIAADGIDKFEPQWSSDAGKVAYISRSGGYGEPASGDATELCIIDRNGSNKTTLTGTAATEIYFQFLPAGDNIGLVHYVGDVKNLYNFSISGQTESLIASNIGCIFGGHFPTYFDINAATSQIFYVSMVDTNLYVMPIAGGAATKISQGYAAGPRVSSGGGKIAYSAFNTVVVSDLDGANRQTIYTEPMNIPDVEDFY
jgi:hypothetical protein